MINKIQNPLLNQKPDIVFDMTKLEIPWTHRAKAPSKREIRKEARTGTAIEALGNLYPGCAIFGLTKGQFSLIELISAIVDQTGPAEIFISTWTASSADLSDAFKLMKSGKILHARFLVDHTFQRRQPGFAKKIRDLFGLDAVRVTRNHAKFCLIRNSKWNIVLKTSMNLNFNPRLEDFDIQDDLNLANYLQGLMDEIFKKIKPKYLYDAIAKNEARFKKL